MAQAAVKVKAPDTLTDADFSGAPDTLTDADFAPSSIQAKEEGNSFLTSPHGFIREGARRIGQGARELFTAPHGMERGLTDVIKGGLGMLTPVGIGATLPALATAPAATLTGLGIGALGSKLGGAAGRKIASVAGGGPEAQELSGTLGQVAGGAAGGVLGSRPAITNAVGREIGRAIPNAIAPMARIRAAAPDVKAGAIKAGIGLGLAETVPRPLKWPARVGFMYPGLNQIRLGLKAGREAVTPETAIPGELAGMPKVAAGATEDTALLDQIAQGFKYKSFANAPQDAQETIRAIAADVNKGPKAPIAPLGPIQGPALPQSRMIAAPTPKPRIITTPPPPDISRVTVTTGEPLSYPGPRQLTAPVDKPVPITPQPPQAPPTIGPTPGVTSPKTGPNPIPPAYRSKTNTGLQIPQEQSNRSAIALRIAQDLDANGITAKQIDALRKADPAEHKLFWNNVGLRAVQQKLTPQEHYSPSPDTIDRIMKILRTKGLGGK